MPRHQLNLIYWTTSNPAPDFVGDVRPGDDLGSTSRPNPIVARSILAIEIFRMTRTLLIKWRRAQEIFRNFEASPIRWSQVQFAALGTWSAWTSRSWLAFHHFRTLLKVAKSENYRKTSGT